MKDRTLYLIWLYLYILCAALGFIPEPQGLLQAMLALAALCFFSPPSVLIYRGVRHHEPKHIRNVRNFSILSLALTLLMIILNLATYNAPSALQVICTWLLALVSTPLGCLPDQIWF